MRVLALETSGRVGSIAVLECAAGKVKTGRERKLPEDQRSARTLLPCVEQLLADVSWRPADVELVCTTIGPGSFTGLRIGVVAAKTFAYATGAKLVGVHTLAAMAENAMRFFGDLVPARIWTVIDAQRKELFVAHFDPLTPIEDQAEPAVEIMGVDDWLARLAPADAVSTSQPSKLRDIVPSDIAITPPHIWLSGAVDVGRLAAVALDRGGAVDPLSLVPRYYRKSAAEEKALSPRSVTGG